MAEDLMAENKDVARRAWLEKLSEFGHIGQVYSWLITDESVADRMQCALRRVYDHYYGGSDFFDCLSGYIPVVFRILSHLVADIDDFEALAMRIPEILKALPYESSGYLDGTDYTFDTTQLQLRAMQSFTAADFLADSRKKQQTLAAESADSALKSDSVIWKSEYPQELAELDRLGLFLVDSAGKDLAGKISQRYVHGLSAVIQNRQDLQNLVAVLRDAAAWHAMSGYYKWPAHVFTKAIAAMSNPDSKVRELLPQDSVLASVLAQNPVLQLRFLAMPDSGLIRNVITQLPIIDPLLSSSQSAAGFIDLLVLMNFNFNIYFGSFLAALPEIAAAASQSDVCAAFSIAREMLIAKHYLCCSDDWLLPLCEVVRAAPPGEPAVLKDIVKLFACGELVRHCVPLLKHGVLWSEIRDNLFQMWQKLRKNFSLNSEARLAVAEIFAREVPQITTSGDFAVFCSMFPEALSPLSRTRGCSFKPRFQSDPPEAMPGADPIPADMAVRLLAPYPKEAEMHGFRHVSVWWNGRAAAFEFNELSSAISGNIRSAYYSLSGSEAWSLRNLAGEKFPPEGNDAALQLTARTLGITLAKLHDLLEKSRREVFPEKGQYDDR